MNVYEATLAGIELDCTAGCHPQSISAIPCPLLETMMNYLCLVYLAQDKLHACPDSACFAYGEELRNSGHYIGGQALQSTDTATTLRVRNGQLSLTDGPFAETKEQLAGFYMIEAKDLNEAIHLASKIPPARFGSIEVRPVRELDVSNIASTQGAAQG